MQHSIFSASAAERWSNCAGSLALSRGIESRSSEAAREGTAGHSLGEACLINGDDPLDHEGDIIPVEGCIVEVTDELALAVQFYVDYVRGISGMLWTEQRTYYGTLLGIDDDEAFGTTDCSILDGRILHVIDAKFGRKFVNPERNKQTILYAAGTVESIEAVGEEVDEIWLHIVQPRVSEKPIPYKMTREQLREIVAELHVAAQRAQEALITFTTPDDAAWGERYLNPGEDQCQWCPAAAFCPALRKVADDFAPSDIAEEFAIVSYLEAVPVERVDTMMNTLPLVERWTEAVKHEAMRRLTRGDAMPSYKLVLGREGNRRYADVERAAEAFAVLSVTLTHKPAELLSPAQMEKMLKKNAKSMLPQLAELVVRNPAKPTLTSRDDPREAWTGQTIAEEFGVVSSS